MPLTGKNSENRTEGAVRTKPNLFELCRIASCFAHSEKQRFFEPEKDAELTVYKQQAPDQLAEGWFIIWYGYHLP